MGRRKFTAATVAVWFMAAMFFSFGAYIEHKVWTECRADHSWFYCMRLMGG